MAVSKVYTITFFFIALAIQSTVKKGDDIAVNQVYTITFFFTAITIQSTVKDMI